MLFQKRSQRRLDIDSDSSASEGKNSKQEQTVPNSVPTVLFNYNCPLISLFRTIALISLFRAKKWLSIIYRPIDFFVARERAHVSSSRWAGLKQASKRLKWEKNIDYSLTEIVSNSKFGQTFLFYAWTYDD